MAKKSLSAKQARIEAGSKIVAELVRRKVCVDEPISRNLTLTRGTGGTKETWFVEYTLNGKMFCIERQANGFSVKKLEHKGTGMNGSTWHYCGTAASVVEAVANMRNNVYRLTGRADLAGWNTAKDSGKGKGF